MFALTVPEFFAHLDLYKNLDIQVRKQPVKKTVFMSSYHIITYFFLK